MPALSIGAQNNKKNVMKKKLYISTSCFDIKYKFEKFLLYCHKNNINNLEFSGIHEYEKNSNLLNALKKYNNINFFFHNYFPSPKNTFVLNFLSNSKKIFTKSKNLIINSVNIARKSKASLYGFHPGYFRDGIIKSNGHFQFYSKKISNFENSLDKFEYRLTKLLKEISYNGPKNDIFIAIENLFPDKLGNVDSFMINYEEIDKVFSLNIIKKKKYLFNIRFRSPANHFKKAKILQKRGCKFYNFKIWRQNNRSSYF